MIEIGRKIRAFLKLVSSPESPWNSKFMRKPKKKINFYFISFLISRTFFNSIQRGDPLVPIWKIFFVSDLHQTWYAEPDFHQKQNLFYKFFWNLDSFRSYRPKTTLYVVNLGFFQSTIAPKPFKCKEKNLYIWNPHGLKNLPRKFQTDSRPNKVYYS